jgi:NADPH:quinone reductase-like Zn-dependent oxidoreductase
MQTYRLRAFGSPGGIVVGSEPKPTPGDGEVLIRIRASALNARDSVMLSGSYPVPIQLGVVPLSDAAGEIEAVGNGVKRFKAGDRVVNSFFVNWFGGAFKEMPLQYVVDIDGWMTEYKVMSAEALVPMPHSLTFEEAATLPCAAVTAWSALKGIGAGDTVLTQGSGGVALFALQLAKVLGARVIATTTGSGEKRDRLRELGADHVIDVVESPEWGSAARELTRGRRGVDRVVETGGPSTLPQSIAAVALGGEISLVGVLAGAAGGVDFMTMFASQASFKPIAIGSRRDLEDMIDVLIQHDIHPVIDSVYQFGDAMAAWTHFGERNLFGKVVIQH